MVINMILPIQGCGAHWRCDPWHACCSKCWFDCHHTREMGWCQQILADSQLCKSCGPSCHWWDTSPRLARGNLFFLRRLKIVSDLYTHIDKCILSLIIVFFFPWIIAASKSINYYKVIWCPQVMNEGLSWKWLFLVQTSSPLIHLTKSELLGCQQHWPMLVTWQTGLALRRYGHGVSLSVCTCVCFWVSYLFLIKCFHKIKTIKHWHK